MENRCANIDKIFGRNMLYNARKIITHLMINTSHLYNKFSHGPFKTFSLDNPNFEFQAPINFKRMQKPTLTKIPLIATH